jgi:hypothetical protein
LILEPKPSRALRAWWWTLHALLAAAALLPGWPWSVRAAVLLGVFAHLSLRRLPESPPRLVFGSDGSCRIPKWGPEVLTLEAPTRLTRLAIDLRFGMGPRRRVLLLWDQLESAEWARLSAILRRAGSKT